MSEVTPDLNLMDKATIMLTTVDPWHGTAAAPVLSVAVALGAGVGVGKYLVGNEAFSQNKTYHEQQQLTDKLKAADKSLHQTVHQLSGIASPATIDNIQQIMTQYDSRVGQAEAKLVTIPHNRSEGWSAWGSGVLTAVLVFYGISKAINSRGRVARAKLHTQHN